MNVSFILDYILDDSHFIIDLDSAKFVIYNEETGDTFENDAAYSIVDDIRDICETLGTDNVSSVSKIVDGFNANNSDLIREGCEEGGLRCELIDVDISIG